MTPILLLSLCAMLFSAFGLKGTEAILSKRQTATVVVQDDTPLSHWEWWKTLQDTVNALTADTIEQFKPASIPTTRSELNAFNRPIVRAKGPFSNINFVNEIRQQQEPEYLYADYETEWGQIEVDQLLDTARVFKTAERGVGEPIAVRVGNPVFDPNTLCEFTVWKCTTHDSVRMKFNYTIEMPFSKPAASKQFKCPDCEAERRDPSLALKRMGVIELDKITVGNQIITSNGITRDDL